MRFTSALTLEVAVIEPDGALWFTEVDGNKIGRITTAGVISEYPVPTAGSRPYWITAGPDGAVWFTEQFGNKLGQVVFATAGLSVSPARGVFQTSLTFTGNAFTPNENVQIYVRGIGSAVLASATADAGGSFTTTARAPQLPFGLKFFLGFGQSSGKMGLARFWVTPRLMLKPNSGPMGSTTAALGFGFREFEAVKVYWDNPRTLLGTVTTNVTGAFTGSAALTFTVPAGAPLGVNQVFGVGQISGAIGVGSFTVQ